MKSKFTRIVEYFEDQDGLVSHTQARQAGINLHTLREMVDEEILVRESRGLYRLASTEIPQHLDFIIIANRIPNAVVCLISALVFHDLTTQLPYKIYIALPKGNNRPSFNNPPLEIVWLSEPSYSDGIETHQFNQIPVKIYAPEKSVADCFKFRNKVGKAVALEALQDYLRRPQRDIPKLLRYAETNRVKNILIPYLEALV